MRFIGINSGQHDAGIVVFDQQGQLMFYSERERTSRLKRTSDVGPIDKQLTDAGLEPLSPKDKIFSSWPAAFGEVLTQSGSKTQSRVRDLLLPVSGSVSTHPAMYFTSHHLSHACASWMFRSEDATEEALYIVFDGNGIQTSLNQGFYSVGTISNNSVKEIEMDKLDKRKFSSWERLSRVPLPGTSQIEVAGKLMGMAGYCRSQKRTRYEEISIPELQQAFSNSRGTLTTELMVKYATVYQTYVGDMKELLKKYLTRFAHRTVIVGGGTFLGLELNTFIQESQRNVIFAPPINDSGLALGSAALGFFLLTGRWPQRLSTPFLQWFPSENRADGYISPRKAAEMLNKGDILGLLIGKGEAGPRALGNRSLIARPNKDTAHQLSVGIKGREVYRPLAPIVTDESFDSLFSGPRGRYMQFRNTCKEKAIQLAPGIVHMDQSARAQVLDQHDNPWLYETLVEFGKLCGVECLINTSLNGRGRPICNTVADAKFSFSNTVVKLVYF